MKNLFIIFILLIICSNIKSQIVYTDVIPDATILNTYSYGLDLNNDGTDDFEFLQLSYGTDYMAEVNSLNNNEGLVNSADYAPYALNPGDFIGNNQLIWLVMSDSYLAQNSGPGNWSGVSDKYLGLRFKINNQWHYGWARLNVDLYGTSITLKDYAYESQPDVQILAGDMGTTSINTELNEHEFSIYFPDKNKLCVESNINIVPNTIIAIYNFKGQTIKAEKVNDKKTILDLSNYVNGIYLLRIYNRYESYSKKILIQNNY